MFRFQTIIFIIIHILSPFSHGKCDRTPFNNPYPKTVGTDRFHIQISGNPETYVPGEQYTVFLRGTINAIEQHKFKDFLLVIEQQQQPNGDGDRSLPQDFLSISSQRQTIGHFTLLGDALTKFSDMCPHAVSQTNSLPKTEIQVFWKAPESGSGCVAFHATVIEQRDLWYMDDGDLTKVLCEEVTESEDSQPTILEKCCACDEAKYEVTFEGLWSRNTHPKDFPSDGWLTRFSDVIGASHTRNYTFWNYGEYASEGLRQVAENGNTRMLESELKGKSDHIRTIIKARGISYPNVTGKTFAVFRVDNQHHLMSLVSMIDPSPDWFVGVSSLELCLRNCSWIESKMLNLYPWDAGTDDGLTYISADQPSTPRSPIRKIKSNSPNDPRSPFYDAAGEEMKPLARLYLSRQRLYEKPCDTLDQDITQEDTNCAVTDWSEWSQCSVTCGRGIRYRQRKYLKDSSRYICSLPLTSRSLCWAQQRTCPDRTDDRFNDPKCQLSEWSEWSTCSVTCGVGSMTRDRRFLTRNATKHCLIGVRNPPKLGDTKSCIGPFGSCDGKPLVLPEDNFTRDCVTRPWTNWSPCSVSCGNGYKVRYRDPIRTELSYEDETDLVEDVNNEEYDPCEEEEVKETVGCQAEVPNCDYISAPGEVICSLPKEVGPCRADIQRWYFDSVRLKCDLFSYTGCHGNRNNFVTDEQCEKTCGNFRNELIANRTAQKKQLGVSVSGVLSYNLQLQDDANLDPDCVTADPINGFQFGSLIVDPYLNNNDHKQSASHFTSSSIGAVIDCETTRWSKWTPCNVTNGCGKGTKQKHRDITMHPMNGGQPCPKKLLKIKKCRIPCDKDNRSNELTATWGSPSIRNEMGIDCMMSNWSPWSPCTHTCGPNSIQQRTRRILVRPTGAGRPCMSRTETRPCNTFPCPAFT